MYYSDIIYFTYTEHLYTKVKGQVFITDLSLQTKTAKYSNAQAVFSGP